jgi:hypothetical protein
LSIEGIRRDDSEVHAANQRTKSSSLCRPAGAPISRVVAVPSDAHWVTLEHASGVLNSKSGFNSVAGNKYCDYSIILQVSTCDVLVDFPAFHYEDYAAHGGDVLERIAIQSDDVGLHARSDSADPVLHP